MNTRYLNILLAVVMLASGTACSVIPKPLSTQELQDQAELDKQGLHAEQETISGPVTLYEAMARALKYNLDLRLEVTEKILAQRELDLSRYDQLPDLVANFEYRSRSNFSGANSQSLLTGVESLVASTSSERDVFTRDLTLSWNILDFGVSYIRAGQAADRVLIAEEQRRKVINQLIEDVRTVYWRAVSNDRLIARLEQLLVRVTEAIRQSQDIELNRLDKPLTALTYQRELIGIKRELQELQRELSIAKIQLAALMNLPPGQSYELALPERSDQINTMKLSPQMIEELALVNRSEIREVTYEKRINASETRAAILQLLPGLNLNFGKNYNTNEFLFNNDWLSYGARIGWNLLNIFKIPATKRAVETQGLVLDARRLALSMAILTQVHVGLARYQHASREYRTAAEYHSTQVKILDQIRAAAETRSVSEQSVIREEMNTLVADVKYDIAYADLENSFASIYASMGIDPVPADADYGDIQSLSRSIESHFNSMAEGSQTISMSLKDINELLN